MNRIASRRGLMLGAVLAGVSFLSVAAASAGDVTVWVWDPNFNGAAMKEAASRYAAINPEANIIVDDSASQDRPRRTPSMIAVVDRVSAYTTVCASPTV